VEEITSKMSFFVGHVRGLLECYEKGGGTQARLIEARMSESVSKIVKIQKKFSLGLEVASTGQMAALKEWRNAMEVGFGQLGKKAITAAQVLGLAGIIILFFVIVVYSIGYLKTTRFSSFFFSGYLVVALLLTVFVMISTVFLAAVSEIIHQGCKTVDGPLRFLAQDLTPDVPSISEIFTCLQARKLGNSMTLDHYLHNFSEGIEFASFLKPPNMIGYLLLTPEMEQKTQDNFVKEAALTSAILKTVSNHFTALAVFSDVILSSSTECLDWQSIYQPYRDSFCVQMQSGAGWWVFGSFPFALGILLLSVSVCLRRRDMRPITVIADDDDDDDPNPELARFALGKFL
jgi:hypothetical protein